MQYFKQKKAMDILMEKAKKKFKLKKGLSVKKDAVRIALHCSHTGLTASDAPAPAYLCPAAHMFQ